MMRAAARGEPLLEDVLRAARGEQGVEVGGGGGRGGAGEASTVCFFEQAIGPLLPPEAQRAKEEEEAAAAWLPTAVVRRVAVSAAQPRWERKLRKVWAQWALVVHVGSKMPLMGHLLQLVDERLNLWLWPRLCSLPYVGGVCRWWMVWRQSDWRK